jgi:hypothetical protein
VTWLLLILLLRHEGRAAEREMRDTRSMARAREQRDALGRVIR